MNSYEQSVMLHIIQLLFTEKSQLLFTEKSNMASFLEKIVDDIEDFRCECKISESCQVCETKKWMQMLQQYNGMLATQQLPTFPEENFNIPLYLSKVYEIIHAVFIFKSAAIKNQTNYEDEFYKLRSDNESLKVKAKRLQDEIDAKYTSINLEPNKLDNWKINQLQFQNQAKQETINLVQRKYFKFYNKEELNQKLIKLQNKVQVMQNDFKKKELEFLKMKDQLRSKDRITYANRYDTMPLKSAMTSSSGYDTWVHTRKGLIDELCQLQDTSCYILNLLNQFFSQISNFEPINPDIIKLPQHGSKCVMWLKSQLTKFNVNIDLSSPTQEKQLTKVNGSHSKTSSIANSAKKDYLNRSHTLHFQQGQPDETMSIISRISINDVSLSESVNSAKFVNDDKPQDKGQLKKWEFVFK